MTQEALKLALEWAEANGEIVFAGGGMDAVNKMNSWVTAIKEALAQPEQEPVAKVVCNSAGQISMQTLDGNSFDISKYVGSMFYTTPPQRTWVGLTNDEQQQAYEQWQNDGWGVFYNAIEAKLKEKNT